MAFSKFIALRPEYIFKVIDVQAANAAAYPNSLKEGKPIALESMNTIADGIAVGKPGDVPFQLIQQHVDEIRTVSEASLARALLLTLERSKLQVEAAGIAAVAAILDDPEAFEGPVVASLSGGNIDPLLLQKVVGHGLAAAERYTSISVMLPDRPGMLVKTAEAIASAHGNVVEVLHTRHGKGLEISEVELKMSVETTGHEHRQRVLKALQDAGLKARIDEE